MKKYLFIFIFLLCACSSAPVQETKYFILTPNISIENKLLEDKTKTLFLDSIKLANFLDQPGIVLQTAAHQIEIAHYHRWGEPLKRNLNRYILETLNTTLPHHKVHNVSNSATKNLDNHLTIHIHQFNGGLDGTALLSGSWTLNDPKTNKTLLNETFNYRSSLSTTGYPELVSQLASLVDKLCNDMAHSISTF